MKPTVEGLDAQNRRELACMDIVGGIGAFEGSFRTPGMDFWISTIHYQGNETGGDVHYVSLCGGGFTTRMLVADVSGHGTHVREYSEELRRLVKRYINSKSQVGFMKSMNQGFAAYAELRRFATAVVATYRGVEKTLEMCIAGHPRPLLYRTGLDRWQVLGEGPEIAADPVGTSELPIGIDEELVYSSFGLDLEPEDTLFFYTDSLTESQDPGRRMLGEPGLLNLAREALKEGGELPVIGRKLLARVAEHRAGQPADDDETIMLARARPFSPNPYRVGERVRVIGKFFGLIDY
jgi:serine phosphatase RsbU (regulator of sigma subunit)